MRNHAGGRERPAFGLGETRFAQHRARVLAVLRRKGEIARGAGAPQPLWSSGFRPFFLLAASYGPLCLALWLLARNTGWPAYTTGPLWHAHEMLFGFAAALVCGVLLTALPSWSRAAELRGAPLAALAVLWLAGRVADRKSTRLNSSH